MGGDTAPRVTFLCRRRFVELLQLQPGNFRFLKLLAAMCTCDGNPVPCNQEAITDVLLKDDDVCNTVMVLMRVSAVTRRLEVRCRRVVQPS
jgi:hypothetical protein